MFVNRASETDRIICTHLGKKFPLRNTGAQTHGTWRFTVHGFGGKK
jgi:hypothetical protein